MRAKHGFGGTKGAKGFEASLGRAAGLGRAGGGSALNLCCDGMAMHSPCSWQTSQSVATEEKGPRQQSLPSCPCALGHASATTRTPHQDASCPWIQATGSAPQKLCCGLASRQWATPVHSASPETWRGTQRSGACPPGLSIHLLYSLQVLRIMLSAEQALTHGSFFLGVAGGCLQSPQVPGSSGSSQGLAAA